MPKTVAPLTDFQAESAKRKNKAYKLADGGGLYLAVMPTGRKLWRTKFFQTDRKKSWLAFHALALSTIKERLG